MEPNCNICPVPAVVEISVLGDTPLPFCGEHVHVAIDDLLDAPMPFTLRRL